MKAIKIFISILIWIWCIPVCIFWAGNSLFTWRDGGFSAVAELLSPWNIRYYLTVFITFLPAVGLYWIKEKIEDKIQAKPAEQ